MLIDWCPGGPQIRTGCVLDAGTCIQYASSTKWAIPKSPKKDKKFFSLTFLSRPCDKTSRPCDKTSRPPPIFVTFMSRPCDKTSRPCDKTSRPLAFWEIPKGFGKNHWRQFRTGCVLDAGSCIQYASSTDLRTQFFYFFSTFLNFLNFS